MKYTALILFLWVTVSMFAYGPIELKYAAIGLMVLGSGVAVAVSEGQQS